MHYALCLTPHATPRCTSPRARRLRSFKRNAREVLRKRAEAPGGAPPRQFDENVHTLLRFRLDLMLVSAVRAQRCGCRSFFGYTHTENATATLRAQVQPRWKDAIELLALYEPIVAAKDYHAMADEICHHAGPRVSDCWCAVCVCV